MRTSGLLEAGPISERIEGKYDYGQLFLYKSICFLLGIKPTNSLSLVWCSATEAAWECITSAAIYVLASLENVKAREKIGYKDLKD